MSNQNRVITQAAGFPSLPFDWVMETESFPSQAGNVQLFAMLTHKAPWTGHRALIMIHGMGEHSGRYLHLPHFLQKEVDAVYIPDLQGHGASGGIRGHIERFDMMTDDLAMIVRRLDGKLKDKFGKSEIHLLGHSLGGHLLIRLLQQHPDLPVASATVSAPFLGIKAEVPAIKRAAAGILSKVWKTLALGTGLDAAVLSRDPAVVEHYKKDPLNHDKMTPSFFKELLWSFNDTLSKTAGINVPLQVLVPLADQVVDSEKTFQFFNALSLSSKRVKTYPGFFHEPMNEMGKEQVFEDILSWIAGHHRNESGF